LLSVVEVVVGRQSGLDCRRDPVFGQFEARRLIGDA
jgi:hypothetical protein